MSGDEPLSREASWREWEARKRADIAAAHAAAMAGAEGLRKAVLALHAPARAIGGHHCEGCDLPAVAEEYEEFPKWPCRTYTLAAGWPE